MSRKTYREQQSVNDYVSIFGGLLLFGFGISRRKNTLLSALAVTIGASKIAEGVSGYSPLPGLWEKVSGAAQKWQGNNQDHDLVPEDPLADQPIENHEHQEPRPRRQAVTRRL